MISGKKSYGGISNVGMQTSRGAVVGGAVVEGVGDGFGCIFDIGAGVDDDVADTEH